METTKAILTIDKLDANPIPFVSLVLEQYLMEHSRVEIKIDLKDMGPEVLSEPMQKTALINETFQIDIQSGDDRGGAYGFLGLITDVQVKLDAGDHGWLIIRGASRSIELERGKMLQTFSDTDLRSIVDEVTQGLVNLEMTNQPEYAGDIKFSMQYMETDYQYLKRLAYMYGEKFFFSGDSLVFGSFDEKDTVKITYGKELAEVNLNSRLLSNKFTQYRQTATEHDYLKNPNPTLYPFNLEEGGTFTGEAGIQSGLLNASKQPQIPSEAPAFDSGTLEYLAEMRGKTNFNRMFFVSGRTKLYRLRIGGLLEIDFHDKMVVAENMGTLRVTMVRHCFDEQSHYFNEFEACQTQYAYFPYPEVEFPNARPIEATVTKNYDEKGDGLGKVQLQFDFEKKVCDYWFRCLSPDAGGNENIGEKRNRGFGFVPEIKDRVLVSFMGGNPDKPFVMGSLFHGDNAENIGGGKGNHVRFYRDKSGSEVVFNDKDGSIRHFSKKGNSTVFLDGKGNVSISTPNTITLSAENVKVNATDIKLNASSSIKIGQGEEPENIIVDTLQNQISVTSNNNSITGKNHITGGDTKIDGGDIILN